MAVALTPSVEADHYVGGLDDRVSLLALLELELVNRFIGDRRGDRSAAAYVDAHVRRRRSHGDVVLRALIFMVVPPGLLKSMKAGYVPQRIKQSESCGDNGLGRTAVAIRQARGESPMKLTDFAAATIAFLPSLAAPADAGVTHVAVAANFTEPAKEIATLFKQKTGHEAVLIFGASADRNTSNGALWVIWV